jgi:hypothetical protein
VLPSPNANQPQLWNDPNCIFRQMALIPLAIRPIASSTPNEILIFLFFQGALSNLGHAVGRGTIAEILVRHGIEPAPERERKTTWKELAPLFFRSSGSIHFSGQTIVTGSKHRDQKSFQEASSASRTTLQLVRRVLRCTTEIPLLGRILLDTRIHQ